MLGKNLKSILGAVFDSVSGIGTENDPGQRMTFDNKVENFDDATISSAYTKSGLIQKIINLIPETAAKFKVIDLTSTPQNPVYVENSAIDLMYLTWKSANMFSDKSVNARLFKESYIYISEVNGQSDPSEPLDIENITSLEDIELYSFERGQITFTLDEYQNRELYRLKLAKSDRFQQDTYIEIHPSRILLFCGKKFPAKIRSSYEGYHGSVIGGLLLSYGKYTHSTNIVLSLLARVCTFVFKMAGLGKAVAEGKADLIAARLNLHKKAIGSVGGLVIDAESEDIEWLNLQLTHTTEVTKIFKDEFTAQTELTHDQLWNEGTQLTASELEARNWENKINMFLSIYWEENFNRLYEIACQITGDAYEPVKLLYKSEGIIDETTANNQNNQTNNSTNNSDNSSQETTTNVARTSRN